MDIFPSSGLILRSLINKNQDAKMFKPIFLKTCAMVDRAYIALKRRLVNWACTFELKNDLTHATLSIHKSAYE